MIRNVIYCLFFTLVASSSNAIAADTPMGQDRWIEKASRTLRNGRGISGQDRVQELRGMSKPEIVDRFMDDPRFGDTIVDFILYYLSRQINNLKKNSTDPVTNESYLTYANEIHSIPQSLYAAWLIHTEGDLFRIFDEQMPILVDRRTSVVRKPLWAGPPITFEGPNTPITIPPEYSLPGPVDDRPEAEILDSYREDFKERIRTGIYGIKNSTQIYDPLNKVREAVFYGPYFSDSGFPQTVSSRIKDSLDVELNALAIGTQALSEDASLSLRKLRTTKLLQNALAMVNSLDSSNRSVPIGESKESFVSDLVPFDIDHAVPSMNSSWTRESHWIPLRNSSTNFNRKRAAYVLKTFFCDDLTPISIVVPDSSSSDAHGSDAACASCHYKLDPIGGLFRDVGYQGKNFSNQGNFVFDDFKTLDSDAYAEYLSNWQGRDGEWKVGYYRSPGVLHPDWQGDSLSDLWKFMRQAPEVRQCLVERLVEFVLGPEQVYDSYWLESISSDFQPGPDSSRSFKQIFKELVLSNAFAQQDPLPSKCYDTVESEEQDDRPPCAIANILDRSCTSCHAGVAAAGGLDLSKWIPVEGEEMGFRHLDTDDVQRPRAESLSAILDRITTTDPMLRMPQSGELSDQNRQRLFHWLNEELNQ